MNLTEYVEHFAARVLQDALNEADSAYWLRRARTFDGVGNERCREIAQACRNHAEFLTMFPAFTEAEVIEAMREAA